MVILLVQVLAGLTTAQEKKLRYQRYDRLHQGRFATGLEPFVGGHAEMGDRKSVGRYLSYLTTLREKVLDGMLAGQDLATLNAEGVYRDLADRSYVLRRPNAETSDGPRR